MRHLSIALTFLIAASAAMAQGDDPEEYARKTIGKALKATGVEGKAIPKALRVKNKFTVEVFDGKAEPQEVKVAQTFTIRFPLQFKEVNELTAMGETMTSTTIFDGKNGWTKFNGRVDDADAEALKGFKDTANVVEATFFLTPLLDKQKYKLKAIGMALVEGRRTAEILVSIEGFRDMKLYFDYRTNLLVKMESKVRDSKTGMECDESRMYRSYEKINGRMVPMTVSILRNGELAVEIQTVDYTELNDVDPKEFARPSELN